MPYVRVGQRAFLLQPAVPNQPINPRFPIYQQPPRPSPPAVARNEIPQQLPVLHPPFFPKENEFYEEEQQEYGEAYPYTTVLIPDQRGTITQQFSNYRSFQHYPKQQLFHPALFRPPSYVYYHR